MISVTDVILWLKKMAKKSADNKLESGTKENEVSHHKATGQEAECAELYHAITVRDRQIEKSGDVLIARDEQITEIKRTIAERDNLIEILKRLMCVCNKQLVESSNALSKHDGRLAEQNTELASLKALITERDLDILHLNEIITDRDRKVSELTDETVGRGKWALDLDKQLEEANARFNQISRSFSWRITLPLRELKRWVFHPVKQTKYYLYMIGATEQLNVSNEKHDKFIASVTSKASNMGIINMPFLKLTAKDAIKNLGSNKFSRWYKAGIDVTDKLGDFAVQRFKNSYFTPGINTKGIEVSMSDKVFTIGSCFARGIEASLLSRKFDVLSASSDFDSFELINDGVTALGSTNKYNTYSILNEIQWALDSGCSFPKGSIVEVDDGNWVDPHINPTLKIVDKDRTFERRQIVANVNKKIKDCNVIVITLGLIEVWRDDEADVFLNMAPTQVMQKRYEGRYSFHVAGYDENLKNLEKISELLSEYGKPDVKIIVTVSPVPLNATFTQNDVVVANTLSKSTLRAVAEAWASKHDNIVYFPSYEIVMNSDKKLVWAEDARHVNGSAVKHIMDLFMKKFCK